MRRRLLVFGLFGTLCVAAALGASGGSAATSDTTGRNGSSTGVSSISCAAAGECAGGGSFTDGSGHPHAIVVNETNGVWDRPIEVLGTQNPKDQSAAVSSVSCAVPGDCAAVGSYFDGSGAQAFVVDETNGVWGDAIEVPGVAALNSGGYAFVSSVSCAAAGECAAGGEYDPVPGDETLTALHPFVVNETNGVWGDAISVPDTVPGYLFTLNSVSCAAIGNCAATGRYWDNSGEGVFDAFVMNETNGVWGDPIQVPGTPTLNSARWDWVGTVSCAAVGNCSTGGYYTDGADFIHGHQQALVVSETNGVWGDATEVPGKAAPDTGLNANVNAVDSVSCAAAGDCAAGGTYISPSGPQAFLVNEKSGVWGNAIDVPGLPAPVPQHGVEAEVRSVSCAAAGDCAGGGTYTDGSNNQQAFVVSEANGVWHHEIEIKVPGLRHPPRGSGEYFASVNSVSCGATGDCAAGGVYWDGFQGFVVNETNGVWGKAIKLRSPASLLRAGATTCNGTYAGRGSTVVVPAFATCTLLPGTRVTGNITVREAGNLNLDGVRVSGDLTVLAGVTRVCGSTIGGKVDATEGSLILGGPNCAANTISGSVVVQDEPHKLRVWGNTINGNLTVNHATGRIDSIVNNTITGNLLVERSGPPVEVRGNHAANATCINNTGRTGSGNVATGTNTCPH